MKEIKATDVKTNFFKILEQVKKGESFYITHHGVIAGRISPVESADLEQIKEAVSELKKLRLKLNPKGRRKLTIKDLISEGRR
jgi:prevent-host-death family protein